MKEMLEAGIHFGHQKSRWNPKMKNYIFMARNGIHIIDLKKSRALLEDAANLVSKTVASGKSVLFVATKKQGRECLKEHALRCGQYYVTERWMGGMLTNFGTISKGIETLNDLEKAEKEGYPVSLTKKEILRKKRKREKLEKDLTGIRNMKKLPGVVIVVDIKKEQIAVREAKKLKIPCIGIVDTNCDPTEVDYPIPGNDDAIKSISMIVGTLADFALLSAEGAGSDESDAVASEKISEEITEDVSEKAPAEKDDKKKPEIKKPARKKTTSKAPEKTVSKESDKDVAEVKTEKKEASKKPAKKTAAKTTKKTTAKTTKKTAVKKAPEKKTTEAIKAVKTTEKAASDDSTENVSTSEEGKESGE